MELHELALPQRILDKIVIHPETGCWLYQGCTSKDGYAQLSMNGRTVWFHRYMLGLALGRDLAPGMHADHLNNDRGPCRFRNCGCPDHLQEVPQAYNSSVVPSVNGAKESCPRGHLYSEHGKVYQCKDGRARRFCLACKKRQRDIPC